MAVVIEEIAKPAGVAALIEKQGVSTTKDVLSLSLLPAASFLVGVRLLLVSLKTVSQSAESGPFFGSGLLVIPPVAHVLSTLVVCVLTHRIGVRHYAIAVLGGSVLHGLYGFSVVGGIR